MEAHKQAGSNKIKPNKSSEPIAYPLRLLSDVHPNKERGRFEKGEKRPLGVSGSIGPADSVSHRRWLARARAMTQSSWNPEGALYESLPFAEISYS